MPTQRPSGPNADVEGKALSESERQEARKGKVEEVFLNAWIRWSVMLLLLGAPVLAGAQESPLQAELRGERRSCFGRLRDLQL